MCFVVLSLPVVNLATAEVGGWPYGAVLILINLLNHTPLPHGRVFFSDLMTEVLQADHLDFAKVIACDLGESAAAVDGIGQLVNYGAEGHHVRRRSVHALCMLCLHSLLASCTCYHMHQQVPSIQ